MKLPSLNRNQIKYIVIAAMVIDHVAWAFVPTASPLGELMHFVGRLTGPTMAYFLVEGYLHTRNVRRYALRLAGFALLSWPVFTLFEYGRLPIVAAGGELRIIPAFGVIYTLLLSLLAVWLWDRGRCPVWVKLTGIAGLCALSIYGDWPVWDVLFALAFFQFRSEPRRKWGAYCFLSATVVAFMMYSDPAPLTELLQCGTFLVPLLLRCYNGEGGSRNPVHKWFFYFFYPAHLVALHLVERFLF